MIYNRAFCAYFIPMKDILLVLGFMTLGLSTVLAGQITRVEQNGDEIELDDLLPEKEPAMILFFNAWEQDSQDLIAEVETWSGNVPDLQIFMVDAVNPQTAVYRQFALSRLPTILVFDKKGERVGAEVDEIYDLDRLLKDHRVLD